MVLRATTHRLCGDRDARNLAPARLASGTTHGWPRSGICRAGTADRTRISAVPKSAR
jgi:hypothetical protein